MPDSEASWFYMWGGRGYHQSGMGTDDGSRPDIIKRHSAHVEEKRKAGNIPTGDIHLVPTWKHDYIQMLKEYVNKGSRENHLQKLTDQAQDLDLGYDNKSNNNK